MESDRALLFTLRDSDGIRSREAMRLALSVVPDEPPKVEVRLVGIGTAITPKAQLPAAGEVSDDYGVAGVLFEVHADDAPEAKRPLPQPDGPRDALEVQTAFEVGDLQLAPKQKLHICVQAADTFALAGGPNVGTGPRYTLDIVTDDQLRAMLEARELLLRRRFETIVAELSDTRNLLASIELVSPKSTEETTKAGEPATAPPEGDEAGSESRPGGALGAGRAGVAKCRTQRP